MCLAQQNQRQFVFGANIAKVFITIGYEILWMVKAANGDTLISDALATISKQRRQSLGTGWHPIFRCRSTKRDSAQASGYH